MGLVVQLQQNRRSTARERKRGLRKHFEPVWKSKLLTEITRGDVNRALACAVDDFTLHDFRRTAATMMTDLGIPPNIIKRILTTSQEAPPTASRRLAASIIVTSISMKCERLSFDGRFCG